MDSINEEVAHKKYVECTDITELRNMGKFLCMINVRGRTK
jgi:hypothetical protein